MAPAIAASNDPTSERSPATTSTCAAASSRALAPVGSRVSARTDYVVRIVRRTALEFLDEAKTGKTVAGRDGLEAIGERPGK